jgi:2-aminoadipate transaminase
MVRYGQYKVPSYEELVNFGVGQPSTELLPLELIKKAMIENLDINDPSLLQYGDIPGYYEFRESLGNFLSIKYNLNVEPDDLFVSNGVTQALGLICSLFTQTGDLVIVEEPTYFLAINIFKDFNLNIKSIKMEEDGACINELAELLEDNKTESRIIFYTIPAFHNPTSITMSHEKRVQLGGLADKYNNMLVIADEVYQLLYFDDDKTPPNPLKYYHENFISLGSFSKILAPSLRLGWIHASPKILNKIILSGQLDSSGGLNPFISSLVHKMLDNGSLNEHIIETRKILKERCDILYNRISHKLDNDLIVNKPLGGYFLWLTLKNDIDVSNLLKLSDKHKVKFHSGQKFSSKNSLKNCLRISFSYYSKAGMEIGADRLSNLVNEYNSFDNSNKIAINGANGRLGKLIVSCLMDNNMNYVGPIEREGEIPDDANIIIDVSSETGIKNLMEKLKNKKIPLIIGTTGDLPLTEIKLYSRFAPVVIVSNFSEGIPYILECLKIANNKLKTWDINILEKHHIHKKDKPSGTAKTLANTLDHNVEIESIREGEIYGEHNIEFNSSCENIIIKHTAKNRRIFAEGVIKYIEWLPTKKSGLFYEIQKDKKLQTNIITFEKYSGCGNDFIMIDKKVNNLPENIVEFVRNICPRGSNIGADGVILIKMPYDKYNIKWTYYNSDGSIARMCGNGVRCVAKYVYDHSSIKDKINMITADGIITDAVLSENKTIISSIGKPEFKNVEDNLRLLIENILEEDLMKSKTMDNIYRIDILVNHLVVVIKNHEVLGNLYVNKIGKIINNLLDDKVNVNFVCFDDNECKIRTYERGIFSETLACGTGCCAFATVMNKFLEKKSCKIQVKSGDFVNVIFNNDLVYLEGAANKIYKGTIDLNDYK